MLKQKELLKLILKYREEYENGTPSISDHEYDEYVTIYLSKGGTYRDIYGDSLLQVEYPMMSQQNVYTDEDLSEFLKFLKHGFIIITPKYDGVSIYFVVDKETNEPIYCYSRHNKRFKPFVEKMLIEKYKKSYITQNKTLMNENHEDYKFHYVRCEAIIGKDVFINKGYNHEYANPRNMVAGLLNRKEVSKEHEDIELIMFDFTSNEDYENILDDVVYKMSVDNLDDNCIKDIDDDLREFYYDRLKNYDCDGFVCRLNDTKRRNQLGNDGHHWYSECAIKNQQREELQTKLIDVEWNMNDGGRFTPVGIVDPIKFKDATVSRVMLNSNKFIAENDIKIGSTLTIIKSGDIIPVVIESDGEGKEIYLDECPHCEAMTTDVGAYTFCDNPECEEKKVLLLIKQIVRIQELLNLKGISSAIVRNIYNNIKKDIFFFMIFDQSTKDYGDGIGIINIEKFKTIFKKLKTTPITFGNLFSILQIQGFGKETMEKMDEYLIQNRSKLYEGKKLKDVEVLHNVLRGFFMENTSIDKNVWKQIDEKLSDFRFINKLKLCKLNFYIPEFNEEQDKLPKYIFTGSPNGMSKTQFKKFVEGKAIQVSSVSKADFVLCNDPSKNSKKYQDGIRLNKKVMNQQDFLKEIEL
jgi:NAD-dependent DNA ligase